MNKLLTRLLTVSAFFMLCFTTALAQDKTAQKQADKAVFRQQEIPESVWKRMQGKSVPRSCTVPRKSLRYLEITYCDEKGNTKVGEMVCNKSIADDLLYIFAELYKARYPIHRIALIDEYDADDERSMKANNTSCFCYRLMTGSKNKVSKHGYGIAIDVNPLQNPYVKGNFVSPKEGRKYAFNRASLKDKSMIIDRNDLCYKLFTSRGFSWGGAWRNHKDYQHFEK